MTDTAYRKSREARAKAYAAIDEEREYQTERWKDSACKGTEHSVTEFLVYMRDYVEEALHTVSREPEAQASEKAMHSVRKIAALGVACMEICGVRNRAALAPQEGAEKGTKG